LRVGDPEKSPSSYGKTKICNLWEGGKTIWGHTKESPFLSEIGEISKGQGEQQRFKYGQNARKVLRKAGAAITRGLGGICRLGGGL